MLLVILSFVSYFWQIQKSRPTVQTKTGHKKLSTPSSRLLSSRIVSNPPDFTNYHFNASTRRFSHPEIPNFEVKTKSWDTYLKFQMSKDGVDQIVNNYLSATSAANSRQSYLSKTPLGYTQQKKIIILAQHRTGSTFFSNLLNYNPEIFYNFEPLHVMEGLKHEKVTNNPLMWPVDFRPERMFLQHLILSDFFKKCEVPTKYKNDWCTEDAGICFRYMNDVLIRSPFCSPYAKNHRNCGDFK